MNLLEATRAELDDWHQEFCGCAGGIEDHLSFANRLRALSPIPVSNPLPMNLEFLRELIAFAYEHGYHEHGYDVLEETVGQLCGQRLLGSLTVERTQELLGADPPVPMPKLDFDTVRRVCEGRGSLTEGLQLSDYVRRLEGERTERGSPPERERPLCPGPPRPP